MASNIPEAIAKFTEYLNERFYEWMPQKVFENFDNFELVEDYYELINKPVNKDEIEADYLLREWNCSKLLSILRTYVTNQEFQQSILLQLIQRGSLVQAPFWMLQTHHLLFHYH